MSERAILHIDMNNFYASVECIRFHDLRHSCASLMLANDISMKEIQEWLGHSNISTTANIYAHVDSESKRESARIIDKVLSKEEAV